MILLMRAIASHSQLSRLLDGALTRSPGTASARLTRTRSSTAPSSWKQWQAAPAWSERHHLLFCYDYSKLSQNSSVFTHGSRSMCALPHVAPPCLHNYSHFDSCAPVFRLCAPSLACLHILGNPGRWHASPPSFSPSDGPRPWLDPHPTRRS